MKLNLGCGNKKLNGFINIDGNNNVTPDLNINLGCEILPFKNDSVDYVLGDQFIEHLSQKEINFLLKELHRVCKNGAKIEFNSPYFLSPSAHMFLHKTILSENYFNYYMKKLGMFDIKYKLRYGFKRGLFFLIPMRIEFQLTILKNMEQKEMIKKWS